MPSVAVLHHQLAFLDARIRAGRPGGAGVIRLVAIDVDGTLLTSRHEVTPATAAAIERVRRAGVEVVLTTSRPPRALWPILRALGLTEPAVFIASQGALTGCYSADGQLRVLDRQPMPVGPPGRWWRPGERRHVRQLVRGRAVARRGGR